MTLQEKYIQKIWNTLAGKGDVKVTNKNGKDSYTFPCPFCRHLETTKGHVRDKKHTAILIPLKTEHSQCDYEYVFSCRRGYSPECRCSGLSGKKGGRSFLNFLIMLNPYLAEKYKAEKNGYSHLTFKKPF